MWKIGSMEVATLLESTARVSDLGAIGALC